MNLSFLYFLGEPWFVIPWYAIGIIGAGFLIYDLRSYNTPLKPAMKWAWPIIILFFSIIGLTLYFLTARAPDIGKYSNETDKKRAHDRFEENMWRRVNGAVIHCVAGDGFGIMTAMVIARAGGMSFWQEFWFEYMVGFAIGWFIFQRKSMSGMTNRLMEQLAMAFRGEFFSMLTVMGGMGAVMAFVTPLVTTSQPNPLTFAFWGFGMFGLLIGFVFTYPMNWMMVKLGWKHGMGGMKEAQIMQIKSPNRRRATVAVMIVLGLIAILIPAWLVHVREQMGGYMTTRLSVEEKNPGQALSAGVHSSLNRAINELASGNRTGASTAMDGAFRAAQAGAHSAPGAFYSALEQIRAARISLQQGSESNAAMYLGNASRVLGVTDKTTPPVLSASSYAGATVINAQGYIIGKVQSVSQGRLQLTLGGWHNAWGFIDLSRGRRFDVSANQVIFGPPRIVGLKFVAMPMRTQMASEGIQ